MTTDRLESLRTFHLEDPDDPFIRFALGSELSKREQFDDALRIFKDLVDDVPDYIGTYYHLGKLLEQMDRTNEALQIYRTGIERAGVLGEQHARAELQSALMEAEGFGFD